MNNSYRLAFLWAIIVAMLAGSLALRWKRGFEFETSLFSLLPEVEKDLVAERALDQFAAIGSKRLLFLIHAQDLESSGRVADALASRLKGQPGIKDVVARIDKDQSSAVIEFYKPWRYQLLTSMQREKLRTSSPRQLAEEAYSQMLSPLGPPRLLRLRSDPLSLFSGWMLEAAGQSPIGVIGSRLVAREGDQSWVLVLAELSDNATSMAGQEALSPIISEAIRDSRRAGAEDILRSGFFFHAAAASAKANREMSIIGVGSMFGIILLMLFVFGTLRPVLLVLLSVAVGCICALAVSPLIFSKLHLLTLVFGCSVIGVAVDYGLLYFSGLYDRNHAWNPQKRLKTIFVSLLLAFATTWLAYAIPAILPFPALRQMGVFALLGLTAAWICSILWLPPMSRSMIVPRTSFQARLQRIESLWPRIDQSSRLRATLMALLVFDLVGISHLRINDDVHQLYSSPTELVKEQDRAQAILGLPSYGQFLLLKASDPEHLLRLEEMLNHKLATLKESGEFSAWQGITQFVPSESQQREDRGLIETAVFRPGAALDQFAKLIQAPELAIEARNEWRKTKRSDYLRPEQWLDSTISTPFRYLWLGEQDNNRASLVSLSGIGDAQKLIALASPGISFIDHLAAISQVLARFRHVVLWLLPSGYILAAFTLYPVYGWRTWRALAPAVLGSISAIGFNAWFGRSLNLFVLIGQVLVLAMGVDYGIFILGKRANDGGSTLLGISMAALSTLLSFGLMAFSSTAALADFGLSVLAGIGISWLLAPCFAL